jgi:hypothetical protein
MYIVKHVEIWFDFLYVRVHVKLGIVSLLIRNKM